MKKHELLKYAYDNYPKGLKITWSIDTNDEVFECSGSYLFMDHEGDEMIVDSIDNELALWNGKGWAEIVKQKIAVKVENEKEFKALMKYYDSLGWKWNGGLSPLSSTSIYFPNIINYEDKFMHGISKSDFIYEGGQIIPFSEFAEQNGIKLPLFQDEVGRDMYEGFNVSTVNTETLTVNHDHVKNYADYTKAGFKHFNVQGDALKWIEAHKPNLPEYVIIPKRSVDEYTNTVFSTHLEISGDFIGLINTGKIIRLDKCEIESILDAMNNQVQK